MTYEEAIKLVKEKGVEVRCPHWKYHNCKGAWEEGHNAGPHCIKPRWDGRTVVIYYCGLGRIEETFLREYVKDDDRAAEDWEVVVKSRFCDTDRYVCPEYSKADVEVTEWVYEKQRFDRWVIGHYDQATNLRKVPVFHHDSMDGLNISHKQNLSETSIQIHIYHLEHKVVIINTRNGRCGISKCNDNDGFSIEIGIAIAWARYCNEQIPDYVLNYLEGNNGCTD